MGNYWRKKLAERRRDALQLLTKRAANIHLQRSIRKATYFAELQHEERRIQGYASQLGASFPQHMRERQTWIEEELAKDKGK